MTTSRIIEATAAAAYARGILYPLSFAEAITIILIEGTLNLTCGDPQAVVLARRIAGALLDFGWTMPGETDTA